MTSFDEFSAPREGIGVPADQEHHAPLRETWEPGEEFRQPGRESPPPGGAGSGPPEEAPAPGKKRRTNILYMALAALMTVTAATGAFASGSSCDGSSSAGASGGLDTVRILGEVGDWVSEDGCDFMRFEKDGTGCYHSTGFYFTFTWGPYEGANDPAIISGTAHFEPGVAVPTSGHRITKENGGWVFLSVAVHMELRDNDYAFPFVHVFMEDRESWIYFKPMADAPRIPDYVTALYGKTEEEILTMADWVYAGYAGTFQPERGPVLETVSFGNGAFSGTAVYMTPNGPSDRQAIGGRMTALGGFEGDDVTRWFEGRLSEDVQLAEDIANGITVLKEDGTMIIAPLITDQGVFLHVRAWGSNFLMAPVGGLPSASS